MGFPEGDYTPFGYLRNPFHRASSWQACEGGNVRTADATVGVEWVYPWHRQPDAGAGISLVAWSGERQLTTRADFCQVGYTSRYHSANVLGFDWTLDEVEVAARYFLLDETLCLRVAATNRAAGPRRFRLGVLGQAWSKGEDVVARASANAAIFQAPSGGPGPRVHALMVAGGGGETTTLLPETPGGETTLLAETRALTLAPGERVYLRAALSQADQKWQALDAARGALAYAEARLAALVAEDSAFHATCPQLGGDWPPGWREGLVYDFETTRMLVMPPGGIFADLWPTWMVAWPRIVLAEGVLDMQRLAYADPATAQRAILSLFRDAPGDNVPCVFQDGSFNMVAADGSHCGTSPAWCLPFLNLELLYLRTLDRAWLAELYPYLARYLRWWMQHRTDAASWVVYKCTWEAGEDGNPRLDPAESGDRDISGYVRPVELQAMLAHAAGVMAFFAEELLAWQQSPASSERPGAEIQDRDAEALHPHATLAPHADHPAPSPVGDSTSLAAERREWLRVRRQYRRRTRRLFDPTVGRFRDWLIRERRFQEPRPQQPYWGVDACRYGPLSLTPLLGGSATPAQAHALADGEVQRHAMAPWTWWPSWCLTLVECAAAAGLHELAGEIVWGVLDRVYRQNDRRDLGAYRRPTPGVAREYWPQDLHDWQASDGYGWGATTANLLIRHLLGLQESRNTAEWEMALVPALPAALQRDGARYGLRQLLYRGLTLAFTFTWANGEIQAEVELPRARSAVVRDAAGRVRYRGRPARRHTFSLVNGQKHLLALERSRRER